MRYSWSSFLAPSRVVPTGAVMSRSLVIRSATLASMRVSKRRSRLVRMPTSLGPSVTGMPEILNLCIRSRASWTRAEGPMVTGLRIIPLTERLTMSTSLHCSWMLMFLWMMPMPPSSAMALAMAASVTVSMAALSSGTFSRRVRVSRVAMLTCVGRTAEYAGTSRTSSNVRPSRISFGSISTTS